MTKMSFLAQLSAIKRGERITYHIGLLLRDRLVDKSLSGLANVVYDAYEEGRIILCQRKIDLWRYEYIAVKR